MDFRTDAEEEVEEEVLEAVVGVAVVGKEVFKIPSEEVEDFIDVGDCVVVVESWSTCCWNLLLICETSPSLTVGLAVPPMIIGVLSVVVAGVMIEELF